MNDPLGWSVAAKPCDACKTAKALLFCHSDSTYMCMECDSKLHDNNMCARVWMCEVCEQAPATVTCKADAAVLCLTCDRDIHSANPLASRHERIPVVPFYNTAVSAVKSTTAAILEIPATTAAAESNPILVGYQESNNSICVGHEVINNSWSNSNNNISKLSANIQADMKSIGFLFSDPNNLLEFDYPVPDDPLPLYNHHNSCNDSVVPVQIIPKPLVPSSFIDQSTDNHFEIDFTTSSFNTGYTAHSISQNVSSSSAMDVGVVPEVSCMSSDVKYPFALKMNCSASTEKQASSMGLNREARVMRYREKRKNRKFEKTIRYASRKAYAETRPRIKGRFVKRSETTDDQSDVNRWFTSAPETPNLFGNSAFGVVPSF